MERHYLSGSQLAKVALAIVAITTCSAKFAKGQYTYVPTSNVNTPNPPHTGSGSWAVPARWTVGGNPAVDYPDAPGAAAILNLPLSTFSDITQFTLGIGVNEITLGSLSVNNASTEYDTRITTQSGMKLIFESTSGPATYTETDGPGTNGRTEITAPIEFLSNIVITQDNAPDKNTSTEFSGLLRGASNLTITKNGVANLQLSHNIVDLAAGDGFEGTYVINEGGIRLIGRGALIKSTGVTVNAGGQLQLADNASTTITDWNMASGAVLNLNGNGKTTGTTTDGALRIGIQANRTTTFHNPVVLQSDARINVAAANTTGILDNVVSGSGGLTKVGSGTLTLTNANNSYTGDTQILGTTLSITNPYLADGADVYLTTGSIFNLNFGGEDDIRSLFIDSVAQPIGTYGATGNMTADFQTSLITGSGILDVAALPSVDDADFDGDSDVDGDDFLIWQRGVGTAGGQPEGNADGLGGIDGDDLDVWKTQFGTGGMVTSNAAPVPEPATAILALAAVCGIAALRRRPHAA